MILKHPRSAHLGGFSMLVQMSRLCLYLCMPSPFSTQRNLSCTPDHTSNQKVIYSDDYFINKIDFFQEYKRRRGRGVWGPHLITCLPGMGGRAGSDNDLIGPDEPTEKQYNEGMELDE